MKDTTIINQRVAVTSGLHTVVEKYLPSNYEVARTIDGQVVIYGQDAAGWTLDGYVIPRLASGGYYAKEVTA